MEINEINNPQNISLKKIKTIRIDDRDSFIAANRMFIISEHENQSIKIENINTNLFSVIKFDSSFLIVKFHPKLENIFLLAEENIIKIYEISKDKCQCEERVNVSGHSKPITTAVFSSTDDKIFATFSMDKTLKVWNLENPFCICNILLNNLISEIQIYKNYIFYYDKVEIQSFNMIMKSLELKINLIIIQRSMLYLMKKNYAYFTQIHYQ
jgi:WD40 repeat protein